MFSDVKSEIETVFHHFAKLAVALVGVSGTTLHWICEKLPSFYSRHVTYTIAVYSN
jgi:hypothetical protein